MIHRDALSRRAFLGGLASAAAVSGAPAKGRRKLNEFGYSQVRLTGGPLAEQYQRVRAHFLKLDEDRLLKVYRQRAGLAAPGADMGGWYDADGFVPGHLLGQFISGLSRIHAATGDAEAAGEGAAAGGGLCGDVRAGRQSVRQPQGVDHVAVLHPG